MNYRLNLKQFQKKKDREVLFETCLYYLYLYNTSLNNVKRPLPDRPYNNNKIVRMFSSSISTLLFLLKSDVNPTIYLNRIRSNPVEYFIRSLPQRITGRISSLGEDI